MVKLHFVTPFFDSFFDSSVITSWLANDYFLYWLIGNNTIYFVNQSRCENRRVKKVQNVEIRTVTQEMEPSQSKNWSEDKTRHRIFIKNPPTGMLLNCGCGCGFDVNKSNIQWLICMQSGFLQWILYQLLSV